MTWEIVSRDKKKRTGRIIKPGPAVVRSVRICAAACSVGWLLQRLFFPLYDHVYQILATRYSAETENNCDLSDFTAKEHLRF